MTTTAIVTANETAAAIETAGKVANAYAAGATFAEYTSRKTANTLDAQRADLDTFAMYLAAAARVSVTGEQLQTAPALWHGVSYGLVAGFVQWLLQEGYAIASVNRKLSTVKTYAKLASAAGVISPEELTLIATVTGYGRKEGKEVDKKREHTRTGAKKAEPVSITDAQAAALKQQPETPQGRRDAVIMALLLDHGLRVGELALLKVTDFNLAKGTFTFYRPKVDVEQTHKMTADTMRAVAAWLAIDAAPMGALLRGSRKGGHLTDSGMTECAITTRVKTLGEAVGLSGLSAHDCRHYWATRAATAGTDAFALRDAGGWTSLAMPSRYVERATIANERVKL